MSIDFSRVTAMSDKYGVITQLELGGRVIWKLETSKPIVLQVEKITSDTYANETTYTAEEFVLVDIYPKTANSTVKVTYGGLTKTLAFSGTNALQVYFGTFNGVADSVSTPASGTLTIEGDYDNFAVGTYKTYNGTTGKSVSEYCSCITDVIGWGDITTINAYAFYNCSKLAITSLPSSITNIYGYAFYGCTNLALTSLPSSLTSIAGYAFYDCMALNISIFPEGLTSIGGDAFHMGTDDRSKISMAGCTLTFPSTLQSIGSNAFRFNRYVGDYVYYTYVKKIVMLAENPPTIGDATFGSDGQFYGFPSSDGVEAVVPKGCSEAYKADESWNAFTRYGNIVEVS